MQESEILSRLVDSIASAKSSVQAAEKWLKNLSQKLGVEIDKIEKLTSEIPNNELPSIDGRIVEGVFNGQNMVDSQSNKYPVPANYASKSKLIEGDKLKLTISDNGSFIYKQITLIPRRLLVGNLVLDGSQYQVLADSKVFNVLYASVTFFRAKVGDEVTIIVPEEGESLWAAIENIIPNKNSTGISDINLDIDL